MYHSGNSELEQLEDRHYRFNQKLSELEWDYADMRMDVRQHTENLVDWLSALHFQAPSAESQSGLERLFALQEEFEAEVKDKLEEAKEMVSHKVAEVSQMAHSMAQFLTDAEVEQLLGEFSMDTCWDQAVEAENLAQAKAYSTRLSDLAGQLEAASAQLVDLDKGQATAFDFS